MNRRHLITNELGRASADVVRQLPRFSPFLRLVLRETEAQRDERLVDRLWLLLCGREAKPEEKAAGLELLKNAKTSDEKGDALVDVAWALCQTRDFAELNRPPGVLVRGIYRIALDRECTEEERAAALRVMSEAAAQGDQVPALEGLLAGLLRGPESVLRRVLGR